MNLLLDVGNTRIKWAWQRGEGLEAGGAAPLAAGVGSALAAVRTSCGGAPADGARVASTAGPDRTREVLDGLARWLHQPLHLARSPAAAGGLRNGYGDPGQLGVDRWLAMRGARALAPGSLCVVDAGTATTVDVVSEDGQHLGGTIIPGIGLMQATLHRETGDLERLAGTGAGGAVPGTSAAGFGGLNTADGIRVGSFLATAGLVGQGLAAAGAGATVVLTGGNGASLAPWLAAPVILRPLLVLEGLALAGAAELVVVAP